MHLPIPPSSHLQALTGSPVNPPPCTYLFTNHSIMYLAIHQSSCRFWPPGSPIISPSCTIHSEIIFKLTSKTYETKSVVYAYWKYGSSFYNLPMALYSCKEFLTSALLLPVSFYQNSSSVNIDLIWNNMHEIFLYLLFILLHNILYLQFL
jgi:hypothetical protein